MISEILIGSASFLLALFCLIYVNKMRGSRRPAPGPLGALKDRHTVYSGTLFALMTASAVSVIKCVLSLSGAETGVLKVFGIIYIAFQIIFFLIFVLYAVNVFIRGSGKSDRAAVLVLTAVILTGAAIRVFFSVGVELFFEAVALFGCMILLEQKDDAANSGKSKYPHFGVMIAVAVTLAAVLVINVLLIMNISNTQSDKLGNTQLDVIKGELQDTITEAEANLLRTSIGAEQLMESGASRGELLKYFYGQRGKYLTNDSFKNVYIAGPDWHIVPDFDAPEDFHAAERVWYIGAKDHPGEVFITEPYKDADDGAMCFSVAVLLSDGETVVGMDLNFSKAQESIRRMTEDSDRTAMIVTSGGMIAGYTDMSLVGARADEKLPEYTEILKRVANSKEHDSFRAEIDGSSHMIFSSETSNSWYLILSVDTSVLYGENYRQIAILASVNLLMLAAVVVYCALSSRKARQAENAIAETKNSIDGFSGKIRESAAHLQRLGDIRLFREGEDPAELIGQVRDSGQHLAQIADELSLYSDELYEKSKEKRAENKNVPSGTPSRKVRNGIIAALLVSLVIVLAFCMNISVSWGNTRMNREADTYEGHLSKWLTEQKSVLYVLTDVISSHPELLNDYDGAVRFLKDISDGYSDISLCYMANPYAEHPVIMSNGWEPGEDFRPETRPWYRATELSSDGFNISVPYLDAQSGTYCITLSRIVNGGNGEFLGIFGIDFFLDKLVNVLGESYTSKSYAFLVDSDGIIINHPNNAYQMGGDTSTSIADTEYANAFSKDKIDVLRDYSSQFMACLSRRTDSGFTVVVANRWWSVYGSAVLVAAVLMLIFSACLVFVITLINRLLRWQEEVNRRLVEAADEAQSANRAKSQFLSQMSHEIRTPMNAIIGLDTIALNDDGVSELTRDRLQKIGSSARHMLSLINDILDMSRIESGRMVLKEEKFSFRDFIDQIGVIIGGQCEDKGLQFVCRINGQIDEYFTGDDLKLKQVMINILGNSVKFTDAPGIITFTVEQLPGTDERAALRFIMEDTGIGMDKEFIPKLFEAFSQENAGTTNKYGGSGLGMAITKNIVEMMGGEITVESEKGLGSVFTVSVTLGKVTENNAKITAESAEETQPADASLEGLHILIAEDQELNAEILAELFEMEGMTSEWAENGQRAVEMFSESSPGYYGAILMDMRMPVMDGLTATKKIRGLDRRDAKTIPIIAMTANAFEEDIKQCLDAGMNAHQTKPVNIDALKEALLKYLPKSQNNRG